MKKNRYIFIVIISILSIFLAYKYICYIDIKNNKPTFSEIIKIQSFLSDYTRVSNIAPDEKIINQFMLHLDSNKFSKGKFSYWVHPSRKYFALYLDYPSSSSIKINNILTKKQDTIIMNPSYINEIFGIKRNFIIHNNPIFCELPKKIETFSDLKLLITPISIQKNHQYIDFFMRRPKKEFYNFLDSLNIKQGGILLNKIFNSYVEKGRDISQIDFNFLNVYYYRKGKLEVLFPYHYRILNEKEIEKLIGEKFPNILYLRFSIINPEYRKYLKI